MRREIVTQLRNIGFGLGHADSIVVCDRLSDQTEVAGPDPAKVTTGPSLHFIMFDQPAKVDVTLDSFPAN